LSKKCGFWPQSQISAFIVQIFGGLMLVFQAQKQRKEDEELSAMQRQFLESYLASEMPLTSDPHELAAAISSIEKSFREHGLSDFISTLTPGAQNAIYAASFAWGYENAAKYVKSAMKLSEVQHANDIEEKSKAVVESLQKQASAHSDSESSVSRAVWSFYNEDMKETQVQTARSETITEKERAKQEMLMPHSAPEAIANGMMQQSLSPIMLYCAGTQQSAELRQAEAHKKEEMARLVSPEGAASPLRIEARQEEERKALEEKLRTDSVQEELARNGVASEAMLLAMQRRQELLREINEAEKGIRKALRLLEKMQEDDQAGLKKLLESALPPVLSFELLHRKKALLRKLAVKRQLEKWFSFCSTAKGRLSSMPLGRLIKLVSLSRLFR
jgi:hypothetical protein